MTGNDRLEKVTPSLELVRISNHVIKGLIEANSSKNRSKLFQPSEINHVVWWFRTSKTLFQTFSKCEIPFRRQVCLFDFMFSLSNKIKYCSLLDRTSSLSFRLLRFLWL